MIDCTYVACICITLFPAEAPLAPVKKRRENWNKKTGRENGEIEKSGAPGRRREGSSGLQSVFNFLSPGSTRLISLSPVFARFISTIKQTSAEVRI